MIENRASGKLRTAAALFVLDIILWAVAAVLTSRIPSNVDPASMDLLWILLIGIGVISTVLFIVSVALVLYGVAAHFDQQYELNKRQTTLLEHVANASAQSQTTRITHL
ncbi:hypothetical protein [Gulosibacter chungangensis]|uniref:Uncharacterized protein n=1 Tax=Gulosibacter chungangensis TaxID=979746 RepID=A0A7J5B9R4_9MICO|nr:hypothetical protein [Gulosibacter chungangensis]KAB1642543.1 hypothetical protein F8O05_08695 [Gulosibacter chungangensis]